MRRERRVIDMVNRCYFRLRVVLESAFNSLLPLRAKFVRY